MFIVAEHRISDPVGFANAVKTATPNIPPDLKLHQVLPSADGSSAVCLWEGDSVQKDDRRSKARSGHSARTPSLRWPPRVPSAYQARPTRSSRASAGSARASDSSDSQ